MDRVVARVAGHEGLSPFPCHERRPCELASVLFEAGEVADLVNYHLALVSAQLAPSSKEPADQLLALVGDLVRGRAVDEDRSLVPHQGYPAEPSDQWLLARAFDSGLKAPTWSSLRNSPWS